MKKVVLGMSGGVDSAVAALLLKEKGYEVIGITFKMLENFDTKKAIDTANFLNIEHHVIDLCEEFKKEIIDKFNSDYQNGLTPNPCVLCNKNIKFKYLEDARVKYNADYIATGHYAKIENNHIYKSDDLNKDQSYFLSSIDKILIDKLIFPLESITKEEVRDIASKYNLPSSSSKDSFDVCFIANQTFREYIEKINPSIPGDIINVVTNEVIGTHEGLFKYTIGQRKNVGLSGNEERHYVCGKDIINNKLYVAFGDSSYLYSTSCILKDTNILVEDIKENLTAQVKYHGENYPCKITRVDNNLKVDFINPAKCVTPGQTCVIYSDNLCIGSGTIFKVLKDDKELWYLK